MSWHLEFYATTRRQAIARIEQEATANTHFPASQAAAAIVALGKLTDYEGCIIHVKTNGSFHEGGGQAELAIQQRMTLAAPAGARVAIPEQPADNQNDLFPGTLAAGQKSG